MWDVPDGVVVITGATGGMGRACHAAFPDRPCVLVDLDAGRLAALGRPGDAAVAADVADPTTARALADAVRRLGPLAAWVHTAGLSPTMAGPRRIVEVNLLGTVRLAAELLPMAGEGSAAVLVSSIAGHLGPQEDRDLALDDATAPGALDRIVAGLDSYAAYSASKRGVLRFVERNALAWGARGARIVSISPGLIDTPMNRQEQTQAPVMQKMMNGGPTPRVGRAEEIAAVVRFLCSRAASFVSGCDLRVDGGLVAAMRHAPDRFA